ncbi:MAG: hypothetical protein KAS07_00625 [Candidatus Pacebacteria bacterium]|nr:hypothetical protein [Candidatus Paceibacterota bacterium]
MPELEYGLSLYSKLAFVMAFMNFGLAIVIYLGGKSISSRYFALLPLTYALWTANHGIMHGIGKSYELQHFLLNNSNYFGIMVVATPFLFSFTFPEEKRPHRAITWSLIAYFAIMFPLYYFAGNFMVNVTDPLPYEPYWAWEYGKGGILFVVPFFLLWITSLVNIFSKIKHHSGKIRRNLQYIFWSFFAGGIVPSIVSVILPLMGIHNMSWLSSTCAALWVFILGYSIIKHDQMDVKAVTTELLVLSAIAILFLSLFI